ncbi:MAG: hypothetical protein ACI4SM_03065 [Candidatus Gastranaerophilaceae bacterium]
MEKFDVNAWDYCANNYNMSTEKVGDIVATTLYKNGKIILYEETTKEIKHLENYGDFEITKVLKRIHFDDNGNVIE